MHTFFKYFLLVWVFSFIGACKKDVSTSIDSSIPVYSTDFLRQWMSSVKDDTPLKDITMVGTHDSGAYYVKIPFVQTQHDDILTQLNLGARVLDIRLVYDAQGNLNVYHSIVQQKDTFRTVVTTLEEFLDKNPSESVVVYISREDSSQAPATLVSLLNAQLGAKALKNITPTTNLGAIRGKYIPILRAMSGFNISNIQGYRDNNEAFATLYNPSAVGQVFYSDFYNVPSLATSDIDAKVQTINKAIQIATDKQKMNDALIVQVNTNGTNLGITSPENLAQLVIPQVTTTIKNLLVGDDTNTAHRAGWIQIDFSTGTEGKNLTNACIAYTLKNHKK